MGEGVAIPAGSQIVVELVSWSRKLDGEMYELKTIVKRTLELRCVVVSKQ